MTPYTLLSQAPPGTPTHPHSPCPVVARWLSLAPGTQDGIAGADYTHWLSEDAVEVTRFVVIVLNGELHLKDARMQEVPVQVLDCLAGWVGEVVEQVGREET